MPLQPGRVFLEETCLVTKPALPFAVLKRRLERRLKAMGIKVHHNPMTAMNELQFSCSHVCALMTVKHELHSRQARYVCSKSELVDSC